VVRVTGELDLATAGRLRAALHHAAGREAGAPAAQLVVDLAEVRFADIVGIRPVAELARDLGPSQVRLRACRPSVRRFLTLAGLGQLLDP
jgi:anti-anti-sigma factor